MHEQLELSLFSKINECHDEFIALGRRNVKGLIDQINKARELGLLLNEAKTTARNFTHLFNDRGEESQTRFTFSYQCGLNYIKVARLLAEPITTLPEGVRVLTDVFRMSNALPAPDGHGEQQSHDPGYLGKVVGYTAKTMALVAKWKGDVNKWNPDVRAALKAEIQPMVALYETL